MRSELVGRVSGVVAVQTNKQTPHLSPFFLDLYSQTDKQPVLEKMRFQKITSKEIEIVNGQCPISLQMSPSEKRQMMTILDSDFHSKDAALAHCLFLCS